MRRFLARSLFTTFRVAVGAALELAFGVSSLLVPISESARVRRWWLLPYIAKSRLALGLARNSERLAREAIDRASEFPEDSGHALHYGNIVLGRIKLARGDIAGAETHLLAAGRTLGSPTLCTFGPNMKLAADLLKLGRRNAVLSYLELCRDFWEMNYGLLDEWEDVIRRGKIPSFGAHLHY